MPQIIATLNNYACSLSPLANVNQSAFPECFLLNMYKFTSGEMMPTEDSKSDVCGYLSKNQPNMHLPVFREILWYFKTSSLRKTIVLAVFSRIIPICFCINHMHRNWRAKEAMAPTEFQKLCALAPILLQYTGDTEKDNQLDQLCTLYSYYLYQ